MSRLRIVDVNSSNVSELGFFCAMSKSDSHSYAQKLTWLKDRFAEGLKIKMITAGGRGFIEYIPGEYAWRAIDAPGYMVVHCLWVVGKAKAHGCASALLEECISEARSRRMRGVVAVTSGNQLGLCKTGFFLRQGFTIVDTDRSGLDLVVLKLRNALGPRFLPADSQRADARLTVTYSYQCPYAEEGAMNLVKLAAQGHLPLKIVHLQTREHLRRQAPSAFGSFAISCNGRVLTHLYHKMTKERLTHLASEGSGRN